MDRDRRHQQFEQVLAEQGPALARLAAAYERRPAVREELLQDIAVALWQSLPSFRGEASMKTFVLRVATNRAMTHLARRPPPSTGLDEAGHVPDASPTPEALAEQAGRAEQLQAAVTALPLPLKQVMSLALEGLAPADIAAVLGLGESNVAVRLHRAKARLRDMLAGAHD